MLIVWKCCIKLLRLIAVASPISEGPRDYVKSITKMIVLKYCTVCDLFVGRVFVEIHMHD